MIIFFQSRTIKQLNHSIDVQENGYEIRVVVCRAEGPGVDRPEDIKRVEKLIGTV